MKSPWNSKRIDCQIEQRDKIKKIKNQDKRNKSPNEEFPSYIEYRALSLVNENSYQSHYWTVPGPKVKSGIADIGYIHTHAHTYTQPYSKKTLLAGNYVYCCLQVVEIKCAQSNQFWVDKLEIHISHTKTTVATKIATARTVSTEIQRTGQVVEELRSVDSIV